MRQENNIQEDQTPERDLYTYAIVRTDIDMPVGKLSAQAAHACSNSLINYLTVNPSRIKDFAEAGHSGSRITLKGKISELLKAYEKAKEHGLPCYLMSDSGHILPPHFDGSPVITAVGIGPCTREQAKPVTKKFRCL